MSPRETAEGIAAVGTDITAGSFQGWRGSSCLRMWDSSSSSFALSIADDVSKSAAMGYCVRKADQTMRIGSR